MGSKINHACMNKVFDLQTILEKQTISATFNLLPPTSNRSVFLRSSSSIFMILAFKCHACQADGAFIGSSLD